ncbi:MAG: hypothetical protein QF441_16660 [Bacteriovoracaceae bacterium]|jgi:hypothetical protein|nr:hypothetical protein [Bacteriovoracaceae bacterium]
MKKEILICGLISTLSSVGPVYASNKQVKENSNKFLESMNYQFNSRLFSNTLYEISMLLNKQDDYEFSDNEIKEIYKKINTIKHQLSLITDATMKEFNINLVIDVLKKGDLVAVTSSGKLEANPDFMQRLEELGIVQDATVSTYSTICM